MQEPLFKGVADGIQALEGGDTFLVARMYALLADASVGLVQTDEAKRTDLLNQALGHVELALQGNKRSSRSHSFVFRYGFAPQTRSYCAQKSPTGADYD